MNKDIQKKMEEFKLRSDKKKSLEARRLEMVQPFDEQIAAEAAFLDGLVAELVEWAKESMPEGGKQTHYGVRIERKQGKARVEVKKGIVEANLAADLEKKIPQLVVVERKINRSAILSLDADPTKVETMRRLAEVGIFVSRPMTTKVEPVK